MPFLILVGAIVSLLILSFKNTSLDKVESQINTTCSIERWNENALAWDQLMAEGSPFQEEIVDKALLKLLPEVVSKTRILEIACGNGFLARRLGNMGAEVYAIDSSSEFIDLAKQKTTLELTDRICYLVADATQQETYEKIPTDFDCVVCNMAFMDISDIESVFHGISTRLKPGGSFIITQTHPCFEKSVGPIFHEGEERDGLIVYTHGVKVSRYLTSSSSVVKAVPTLPREHLFFHRSLSTIFQLAFQAGFIIDGFEEVAFPKSEQISEHNGWHLLKDIPVIIGIRFTKLDSIKEQASAG